MRIGVVTASYPRVDGEHAGNFVATQVAALRAAGHTVDVVGAHTIASSLFYGAGAPDELERGGLRRYLAAARFTAQLTAAVARHARDWDLIVAHWLAPSAVAAVIGTHRLAPSAVAAVIGTHRLAPSAVAAVIGAHRLAPSAVAAVIGTAVSGGSHARLGSRRSRAGDYPIPILAIAHGGDIHLLRRLRLLAPALRLLHARGVRLAFVSGELRDLARRAAPALASWLDEALVQPMGIDVARFAALRPRTVSGVSGVSGGEAAIPTIVVIARLVAVKGVDVAIRAVQSLRRPVHLVIAGDGPERSALELLARDSTIRFLGTVDANGRDQLLRDATCLVVPSRVLANGRSEGTPVIALEALAAGVPVIASDVGGLRELPVTRVRPDDPDALATAIDRVLGAQNVAIDASQLDASHVNDVLLRHASGGSCETDDTSGRRSA